MSVPVTISDNGFPEDVGRLVAGTAGFTVEEGQEGGRPVVEARQAWALILPEGSPITPLLRGNPQKKRKLA